MPHDEPTSPEVDDAAASRDPADLDDDPAGAAPTFDLDEGTGDDPDDAVALTCAEPLEAQVEALLISTDKPLSNGRLAELLELDGRDGPREVDDAVGALNEAYDETGRAFRIERLAGGWQILTRPVFGGVLGRLHRDRQSTRLSPAALETLAIIAYRQPIIRAEIEAIRGVACGEVLRGLLERRMVRISGRAEILGRPMLYGTTRDFLNIFGLASLDDLPEVPGLVREAANPVARPKPDVAPDAAPTDDDDADDAGAPTIEVTAGARDHDATDEASVSGESAT
ncbi:MAG: SMC-Scp complex subunit ScpB [Phycisphaerales bacterium]|nr:SMC-Scp complex subunit ScpB [Phycisphaerales bacterium]